MGSTSMRLSLLLLAFLLVFPVTAFGQTVEGRVEKADSDHLVVDSTIFSVDANTRLRLAPRMITDPNGRRLRSYDPSFLDDYPRVRVRAAGRVAEEIVVIEQD